MHSQLDVGHWKMMRDKVAEFYDAYLIRTQSETRMELVHEQVRAIVKHHNSTLPKEQQFEVHAIDYVMGTYFSKDDPHVAELMMKNLENKLDADLDKKMDPKKGSWN